MRSAKPPPTPSSASCLVLSTKDSHEVLSHTEFSDPFLSTCQVPGIGQALRGKNTTQNLKPWSQRPDRSSDNICWDHQPLLSSFPSLSGLQVGKESKVPLWPLSSFQIIPDGTMCPTKSTHRNEGQAVRPPQSPSTAKAWSSGWLQSVGL